MPFLTTRPTSRISPIADETLRSVPVSSSSANAPASDSGAASRISTAGRNRRNCTTRMMNTSAAAIANTVSSSWNDCCCDAYWPPTSVGVADRQLQARELGLDLGDGAAEVAVLRAGR